MDGLREEVTQFVGSGVESLIRKLLSSDEFHVAFARVASLGINYGVERWLRMGRIDFEFEAAVQKVSNFHVGAKVDFDKALDDFPTTPFPFLSKIDVASQGSLPDVAQILPDKFAHSATSVAVASSSASEAPKQRHPDVAIDDPRPATGSFNMADVRRLSTHFIKLRDMPEGVLVLSVLSQVWKSRICDLVLRGANRNGTRTGAEVQEEPYLDVRLTLQRLPFYCTPPAVAEAVILDPTLEDLAVGTPSFKIVAKTEASQKRKASTSGAASSHVAKRTRSALDQSSGSTTDPSLFVGDDDKSDDDDACVEISLVTPFSFAAMIPSLGNEGGSFGKGVMVDDDVASSSGDVSRPRPSSILAPSFKDVSKDAIHKDLFPFSAGPYYATYPEGGIAGNSEFTREEWDAPYRPTFGVLTKEVFKDPAVYKTVVDQFLTPGEMVRIESLSHDQLTTKMSVLHCMIMLHGCELFARYRGLSQSHHEYMLSADSMLKGYEEKVANMTELELQVTALKKQVSGLNDKLATSDASFTKSKAKEDESKKKIKSIDEFSRVQGELLSLVASAGFDRGLSMHQTKDEFAAVLKKMISKHATEPLSVILQLKLEKLAHPANVPTLRDTRVSPHISKESTVKPVFKSLELSVNVILASSVVSSEQNKEQGASHALDDVAEVTMVGSELVSSGPNDVVVALSVNGKGDGLTPSFVAGEEAAVNPSRV
ncbi:hypothetical protein Tco_0854928 [Tanacetum coccineum]